MKTTKILFCLLVAAIALAACANAQVVTYTLNGITFADGATAQGSCNFSSGTISNINTTTTAGVNGDGLSGYAYTNSLYAAPSDIQFSVTPSGGGNNSGPAFLVLYLNYATLGNLGTIPLNGGAEEFGSEYYITQSRGFTGGEPIGEEILNKHSSPSHDLAQIVLKIT